MTSKKETTDTTFVIGDTVGLWTVIGEMTKKQKKNFYPCRCTCGTETSVPAIALANETSLSCGCDKAGVTASRDAHKIPYQLQQIFDLISQGHLPPADGISVQGQEPTWRLASIAKLIGVSESQLIEHLKDSSPRFAGELALS